MTWQLTQADTYDAAGHVAVRQSMTGGSTAGDVAHTWANHRLTRGMFWLVGKGATWPSQGLPRGTPLLVVGLC
jgi:hypothetical protein